MLSIIFHIFIFVIIVTIIIICISHLIKYLIERDEYKTSLVLVANKGVRITFDQFYQWYSLNQKRWRLCDNYVEVEVEKPKSVWSPYDDYYKVCYFKSFKDWKKYKEFQKKLKQAKINEKINQTTLQILEAVQKDINAIRKQSNQEIKEASNRAAEIAERLKEQ